jgi:hypothetical protein
VCGDGFDLIRSAGILSKRNLFLKRTDSFTILTIGNLKGEERSGVKIYHKYRTIDGIKAVKKIKVVMRAGIWVDCLIEEGFGWF